MVQLGRYVTEKVQEKRVEKKTRQAAENGFQIVGIVDGGFVRDATVEQDQKRMIKNVDRKEVWIDEKQA